jgi:hypothetical protein
MKLVKFLVPFLVLSVYACSDDGDTNNYTIGGGSGTSGSIPFDRGIDNGYLFVPNISSNTISILDSDTAEVLGEIDLNGCPGVNPYSPALGGGLSHLLAVTRDGRYLWFGVNSGVGGSEYVYDLKSMATPVLVDLPGTKKPSFNDANSDTCSNIVKKFDGYGVGAAQFLTHNGRYLFQGNGIAGDDYNSITGSGPGLNVYDVFKREYLGTIQNGGVFPDPADPSATLRGGNQHWMDSTQDDKILWTTDAAGGHLIAYDISELFKGAEGVPQEPIVKYRLETPRHPEAVIDLMMDVAVHPNGKFVFLGTNTGAQRSASEVDGRALYVVDVREINNPKILTSIPGNIHVFDISPDLRYLTVIEVPPPHSSYIGKPATVCRLMRIDISELLSESPRGENVKIEKYLYHDLLFDKADIFERYPAINQSLFPATGGVYINHLQYGMDGKQIVVSYITVEATGAVYRDNFVGVLDAESLYPLRTYYLGPNADQPHVIARPGYTR